MSTETKSLPGFVEVLIWALLLFSVACAMRTWRPTPLDNDSYQYLNVAGNEISGRGIATSLICFDSERSHGFTPAPLTTFAPGYPVAISIVSHFFGDLPAASRFISVTAFTATGALVVWALMLMGVGGPGRLLAMTLYATNVVSLSFATSVLTEPLYMLLMIAAVVALIWMEKTRLPAGIALSVLLVAYALAGLSFFVRYAGLFFIAGLVVHASLMLLIERTGRRAIQLGLSLVSVSIAAILMLRNVASVGTWKGGNTMEVHNPFRGVLVDYIKGHFHLFFGEHKVVHGIWELVFLAAFLVAFLCVVPLGVKAHASGIWTLRTIDPSILLIVLCVAIYTGGLFYAGLRTDISFGTRMFEPIFPLYLLLFAMAVSWLVSGNPNGALLFLFQMALVVGVVALAGIDMRDFRDKEPTAPDQALIPLFAEPTANGQSLRDWIAENIPPDATIFAEDGQATGYLLGHPTVDMVDAEYSSIRWECGVVQDQMLRFHSEFLILYKWDRLREGARLAKESKFVAELIHLQLPCGFTIVAATHDVLVLKLADADRAL